MSDELGMVSIGHQDASKSWFNGIDSLIEADLNSQGNVTLVEFYSRRYLSTNNLRGNSWGLYLNFSDGF